MLRRSTIFAALFVVGTTVTACAVGGDDALDRNPGRQIPDPPQGGSGGTFDPGKGGMPGSGASYGSGASSVGTGGDGESGEGGGGGGGSEPPKPPVCSDDLKRCEHEFTYPDSGETSVELRGDFAPGAWEKGVTLSKVGALWKTSVQIPYEKTITYKFFLNGTTWVTDPDPSVKQIDDGFGSKNSVMDGVSCDWWSCEEPPSSGNFDWRDAVLYFVFVDRFFDGDPSNNAPVSGVDPANNYQGGDWKGLQKKIDEGYFNDLGVNALWLTVPLDNTKDKGLGDDGRQYSAYHGYWPRYLDKVEEHFGTLDDLKKLVDSAHTKGIKIILDYAMNHVHITSPVYAQHKDWFWPNENKGNNCVCGQGCSWDDAAEAERCWFRDYLPDFNFGIKEARDFSVSNAIQWVKDTGVDGFRLDAIKHINIEWVKDLRFRVKSEVEAKSGEHFYMVGETFTGDKGTIKKYVDPATLLDGQFDFPLRMEMADKLLMRRGSMKDLDAFLNGNDSYYGPGALMSTFIGNHDIPRAIHLAQDVPLWDNQWADGKDKAWDNKPSIPSGNSAFERLANSFTLLLTTRGVPLIYYGDEVGMAGAGDPDNRRMMQWSNYSPGQTLVKDHIKKLTKIRAEHPALRRGTRSTVSVNDDVLAYKMSTSGDSVYVVINRADGERSATNLPANMTNLLTGANVSGSSVTVAARSSMILIEK